MSICFNEPVGPETEAMIDKLFGKAIASDGKTFLFDQRPELLQRQMTELANKAKQPVTVELNAEGEIKTMMDGTQYRVTPKGWRKIDP